MSAGPAKNPCVSCPYRRDVPSGVWSAEEYDKLPAYDNPEMMAQPTAAFMCHQRNGRLCSGWVGCHDMSQSLGLRLAASHGVIDKDDIAAALDYECPVPLFDSGAEAAEHGMADLDIPSEDAIAIATKIERRRERDGVRSE